MMMSKQLDFSQGSLVRKHIQKEFYNKKWNQFRIWFFETYSENDLKIISEDFYDMCRLHNKIIYFIPWFITTYLPLYINVIERTYKESGGAITKAIYPPQAPFILPNNIGITFSAFQKFIDTDVAQITVQEVNNLISQNNYLSLYVKVLGEHISSLDKKLDDLIKLVKNLQKTPKEDIASTSKTVLNVPTHLQRPVDTTGFKVKSFYKEVEDLLDKKLSGLGSKPISNEFSKKDYFDQLSAIQYPDQDVSAVHSRRFKSGYNQKQKVIGKGGYATLPSMMTYYYPRPTPQDVLVEERDWNQTNTSYSGNEVYEWNIDALTERQVSIVVHRMLMYSSICRHMNNNNDHAICKMIIEGFTGQLRGWWDNFLTPEERYAIMNAYKEEIIR